MFRELTRKNKAATREECIRLLENEKRGVLSVLGDDGYPYGMPMNHYYNPADGHLYFHSGQKGHRSDAMARCDKASYCVYNKGFVKPGDWALNIDSVIVFGRLRVVEDHDRALALCRELSYKFTRDEAYIEDEIKNNAHRTILLRLVPEHICGKSVHEA